MINPKQNIPVVAYFSMEIALDPNMPTYSGGLGMLAGDTLRSVADLAVPLVAVTLVYRRGYFRQHLDAYGQQTEQPQPWDPSLTLEAVDSRAKIEIEGRSGGRPGQNVPGLRFEAVERLHVAPLVNFAPQPIEAHPQTDPFP